MKRVAFGVWLKDRITIWEKWLLVVYGYRAQASAGAEKRAYLLRIVKILTGKRFVWTRHLLYLNRLLSAAGMLNKEGAENRTLEEMEKALHDVCSDVGSRCNKSIHEIMTGMTDKELERYSLKLFEQHYAKLLMLAAIQASPTGAAKEIESSLSEVRSRLAELKPGKEMKPEEIQKDMSLKGAFKWA